jgi:long-subunit fatty acid transport protein
MKNFILAWSIIGSSMVWASGYESSLMFGADVAGVAGVATPYIQGAQSVYFNPAGLANDRQGKDLYLSLDPGRGDFKGPIFVANKQETSEKKILFPFGLFYGQTLDDKLGVGAGLYVSGGAYAGFPNVDITPTGLTGAPTQKTDLTVLEFAVGAGYKLMDNLKIGMAWRVVMAQADFSMFGVDAGGPTVNSEFKDLKDTNYTGFKLGGQYKLNEKTNLGLTYRSEVVFEAKGKLGGTNHLGAVTEVPERDVTVGTLFPAALTLGVTHQCAEKWKMLGEYVFTEYSKVTNLAVEVGGQSKPIQLGWKDQHEFRLASEYSGFEWPLRFGYIWSSQVISKHLASATFPAPGPFNTLTVGSGLDRGSWKVNGALEYGWSKGSADGYQTGKYETVSYGLHLSTQYLF